MVQPKTTSPSAIPTKKRLSKIARTGANLAAPRNTLYLVLHGLICLIDDNRDQFTADLIDMGDDHEYLLGDFFLEKAIGSGEQLHLNGIDPANKIPQNQLDPNLNAVVKINHLPVEDNYYQSRLLLPRPLGITYYIQGTLDPNNLPDPNNELLQVPKRISGIRVFEYSFDDYRGIHVANDAGDIFWDCPVPVDVGGLNVAVLHVFNEPPAELIYAGKHNKDEFNFTLSYLGAQLRLASPAVVQTQNGAPPPGMVPEELHALDVRAEMAQNLMAIVRGTNSFQPPPLQSLKFAPSKLKQDVFGGGGGGSGSQVCGGANALVGP